MRAARRLFQRGGQTVFVALCDRVEARLVKGRAEAERRLANAERIFEQEGLTVDAAVCRLTRAELDAAAGRWADAESAAESVKATLGAAFPDYAWRVSYVQAQVAAGQEEVERARDLYLASAYALAQLRGDLRVERLSDEVFGLRQYALNDGLRWMWQQGFAEEGLALIETAKAQAFLQQLTGREGGAKRGGGDAQGLRAQEEKCGYVLDAKRAEMAVGRVGDPNRPAVPKGLGMDEMAARMAELRELERQYERVVTRLRLAGQDKGGDSRAVRFEGISGRGERAMGRELDRARVFLCGQHDVYGAGDGERGGTDGGGVFAERPSDFSRVLLDESRQARIDLPGDAAWNGGVADGAIAVDATRRAIDSAGGIGG